VCIFKVKIGKGFDPLLANFDLTGVNF